MSRNSQLARFFRAIRWADVLVLQGAPILGVAFSSPKAVAAMPVTAAVFAAASLLLMMHVFAFNDWADSRQREHHGAPPSREHMEPTVLLSFSLSLLVASLTLFLLLSPRLFSLAALIAALGIFYSHPSLNAKSMPIVSTLLHLVGGEFHFLLGYALFLPIDGRGVLIGLFFGLTFAAGHPVQEARDVLEDRHVGAKTNAVVFGQRPSFAASMVLFTVQYLYLFWLAWSELIPRFLAALPIIFYPAHIAWAVSTVRRGLTTENITQFQSRYRLLYAIIGLALLLSVISVIR